MLHAQFQQLRLCWHNVNSDIALSAYIIFPAETVFYWTSLPMFGTSVFMTDVFLLQVLYGALTCCAGGLVGHVLSTTLPVWATACFFNLKDCVGCIMGTGNRNYVENVGNGEPHSFKTHGVLPSIDERSRVFPLATSDTEVFDIVGGISFTQLP